MFYVFHCAHILSTFDTFDSFDVFEMFENKPQNLLLATCASVALGNLAKTNGQQST